VQGYLSENINLSTAEGTLDYYEGAMLKYEAPNGAATGLVDGRTYFVTAFASGSSAGQFVISIAELPEGDPISPSGGGSGQTFSKIGVSVDKNIVHIRNSNFEREDMLEYSFPENGNFGADLEKRFYFVLQAFDTHNYRLEEIFLPISATGGNIVTGFLDEDGAIWKMHAFLSGTSDFVVENTGNEDANVDVLIVAGGGGGGDLGGGGGGAGGLLFQENVSVSPGSYTIVVGNGGPGQRGHSTQIVIAGGQNSSAFGFTAIGGGAGQGYGVNYSNNGGSGGGGNYHTSRSGGGGQVGGSGVPGQGNNGGNNTNTGGRRPGGGGGGWGAAGQNGGSTNGGNGGIGRNMSEFFGNAFGDNGWFAGGGGGGFRRDQGSGTGGSGGVGGGGRGDGWQYLIRDVAARQENGMRATGGGGGGGGYNGSAGPAEQSGGNGGSGAVLIRYPIGTIN
jgi:hypothetical protein